MSMGIYLPWPNRFHCGEGAMLSAKVPKVIPRLLGIFEYVSAYVCCSSYVGSSSTDDVMGSESEAPCCSGSNLPRSHEC